MNDPGSLDRLRDIVEAAPISWWPLAPGWWVVLGVIALVAAGVAYRQGRRWYRDRYRRQALDELARARGAAEINGVLKRTALTAFPRADVAALYGHDWFHWLSRSSEPPPDDKLVETVAAELYRAPQTESPEFREFARCWIRNHQPQGPGPAEPVDGRVSRDAGSRLLG